MLRRLQPRQWASMPSFAQLATGARGRLLCRHLHIIVEAMYGLQICGRARSPSFHGPSESMGGPSQPGTQQYGQYMGPAGQFIISQVDATRQFIGLQISHFHGDTALVVGQSVSQQVSLLVTRIPRAAKGTSTSPRRRRLDTLTTTPARRGCFDSTNRHREHGHRRHTPSHRR